MKIAHAEFHLNKPCVVIGTSVIFTSAFAHDVNEIVDMINEVTSQYFLRFGSLVREEAAKKIHGHIHSCCDQGERCEECITIHNIELDVECLGLRALLEKLDEKGGAL